MIYWTPVGLQGHANLVSEGTRYDFPLKILQTVL